MPSAGAEAEVAQEAKENLEQSPEQAQESLSELDNAAVEDREEVLLEQLAEAASGREGLPIEIKVNCHCNLPADVHIALYRITQEALNNVVKHARASHAEIEMSCSHCSNGGQGRELPREITLLVADDGKGFSPGQNQADRFGSGIMRERAEDINARLEVASEPGAGTRIIVRWQQSSPID